MRTGAFGLVAATARFYAPLIVLFALALLATHAPGGIGLAAGFVAGAAFALQALVFGVRAARRTLPPMLARGLLGIGLILVASGAAFPGLTFASQLLEAGSFAVTVGGLTLIVVALFSRLPTLADAEAS